MNNHNWSGWPGAYCLNCGAGDPGEDALAHGCLEATCQTCGVTWCQRIGHIIEWTDCGDHKETECLDPAVIS